MSRILVIGAGVLGASVADALSEAGADVLVLDRSGPAAGASGATFACVNAARKRPRWYFELGMMGLRAHRADPEHWRGGGRVEWFAQATLAAARRSMERLGGWGYAAHWLDRDEALALSGGLKPQAVEGMAAAWFPDEGWVEAPLYAGQRLARARARGAAFRVGRAVGLELSGERVAGVRLDTGELIEAETVVNCAGAAVNEVAGRTPAVPMASTPGAVVVTAPAAAPLDRIVGVDGLSVRPMSDGRLVVHCARAEAEMAAGDSPQARARAVAAALERLHNGWEDAPATAAVRPTSRPIPADGLPVVGPSPHVEGYYLAVSHSAVTLAPVLGPLVARELAGEESPLLAECRPGRAGLRGVEARA